MTTLRDTIETDFPDILRLNDGEVRQTSPMGRGIFGFFIVWPVLTRWR